jgi:hypothetical protein
MWLTFPRATIIVVGLMVVANAGWFALGIPSQRTAHGTWSTSPSFLACDLILATVGIFLILKYRMSHYRLLVVVYAMLLANVLAVLRIFFLHAR